VGDPEPQRPPPPRQSECRANVIVFDSNRHQLGTRIGWPIEISCARGPNIFHDLAVSKLCGGVVLFAEKCVLFRRNLLTPIGSVREARIRRPCQDDHEPDPIGLQPNPNQINCERLIPGPHDNKGWEWLMCRIGWGKGKQSRLGDNYSSPLA